MSVMIERLEGMVNRYHEINEMMMSPEIVTDSRMLAKLGREQADLTQVVETYTEYKNSVSALEDAKALLLEDDKEIKEMAKMEIEELEPKIEEYLEKLEILLIPKDRSLYQCIGQLESVDFLHAFHTLIQTTENLRGDNTGVTACPHQQSLGQYLGDFTDIITRTSQRILYAGIECQRHICSRITIRYREYV